MVSKNCFDYNPKMYDVSPNELCNSRGNSFVSPKNYNVCLLIKLLYVDLILQQSIAQMTYQMYRYRDNIYLSNTKSS